ncbi:MAG: ferritin-like domain-containing protein [Polyangiaceae bacterium]
MDVTAGHDAPLDAAADASLDGDGGSLWSPGCQPGPPVVYDAAADAPNCAYRVTLPCGVPSFVTGIDPIHCVVDLNACVDICTGIAFPFLTCEVANGFGCDDDAEALVAADGAPIVVECDKCTIAGRRPAGLARPRWRRATDALGGYLAGVAHLEAASVRAFDQLGEELDRLGAPGELVRAARRSARDEVRHARATGRLARSHGVGVPSVRVSPRRAACSLMAMAIENAIEGCVRETFGALVAAWQASHAGDPRIARTMAAIAADETRHAALAWAIAGWAEPRLDAKSRRAVRAARRGAVRVLRRETRAALPAVLIRRAGLPSAARATALLDALDEALWSRSLSDPASAPG